MEGTTNSGYDDRFKKEAPQLTALLKEMKEVLDAVRSKIEVLTAKHKARVLQVKIKIPIDLVVDDCSFPTLQLSLEWLRTVKANQFPTEDGISYLESKHLLLLSYCQSLVYYLLRKAKGFSIEGHPVVQSLIETRLFLEKIRPIDKKLQYQIQKLTRGTAGTTEVVGLSEKESGATQKTEDLLNYRPNPDMLVPRSDMTPGEEGGVYRPPKFAPTSMEEAKVSKQERNAMRMEKQILRQSRQSEFVRELMDDMEGRPQEVRENIGSESRELARYMAKMEKRAQEEEELFIRAPMTKMEKKKEKHLKKSRNGLLGLTDSFYDEIKTLPLDDDVSEQASGFNYGSSKKGKFNKRKRRH